MVQAHRMSMFKCNNQLPFTAIDFFVSRVEQANVIINDLINPKICGLSLSFGCLFNVHRLEISVKEVCILQMFYIEVYARY